MSQVLTGWVGVRFASPAERLIVWLDPCRAHDPEQSLKEWETGLKFGATTLNEYRTQILNLPADDRFDVVMSPGTMLERTTLPRGKAALNRLPSRNGSAH